ncbi:SRPBCC family protein [Asticcacaulis sp.]|uniref:SRPBCC family protein n=1 Tax=Asticcacaulis sp. TaxID=1872648 RepID=UPI00261A09CF|nr:SRPBCC family protein [Asticcacaulis sp.]
MLTFILGLIGLAIAGVLLVAALRPNHFRLQRTATIAASPETLYAELEDLRRWQTWSPWEDIDPALRRTYSGPATGTGSVYEWASDNAKAGEGRMTIAEARVPTKLVIQLDFIKPIRATNTAEFTLQAQDGGTVVTWAMYGPSPFVSRLFGLIFNMDKMIGADFEKGLSRLKALTENR